MATRGSVQVRSQDLPTYVKGIAAPAQERRQEAWRLCYVYMDTLKAIFGGTEQDRLQAVGQLMAAVASGFASERHAMDAKAVFEDILPSPLPQYVLEALDKIRANAAARDRVVPGACRWLQMHRGDFESLSDYDWRSGERHNAVYDYTGSGEYRSGFDEYGEGFDEFGSGFDEYRSGYDEYRSDY